MSCCPRPSRSCARRPSARSAMRHFDVQLIGGMVLHHGKIAEMRTGEGKTLGHACRLPERARPARAFTSSRSTITLRAATPTGWAALQLPRPDRRHRSCQPAVDRGQARRLCRRHHLRHQQRVRLRLPARQHGVRGRGSRPARLNFAIVDEVDSILIDEARTPLIISGPAEDHTEKYRRINEVAAAADAAERTKKATGDYCGRRKRHTRFTSPRPGTRRSKRSCSSAVC